MSRLIESFRQSPPKDVCVLRLSAIGDTCHTLPVIRSMQQAWPKTRFTWVIGKLEASLMDPVDGIELVTLDKSAGLTGYLDVRKRLKGRRFDALLMMHASMRANLCSLAISARLRLGFDKERARDSQWLFSNARIPARAHQHVLDGLFGFAETLGINERLLRWGIPLDDEDLSFAERYLPSGRPALIISPCSSQRFRNYRNWSPENYAAVADHAARVHGARVVLTGGPTDLESEYADRILSLAKTEPVSLIGRTNLKQLLALLDRADLLICPDSGPAHMATAVNTTVIGLYATSNRFRTGPYLSQRWVVDRYPDAVMMEFGKNVGELRWGARVRDPEAMNLIKVEDVIEKLDQFFDS